ncbi:MAG: nucleoside triphosphate pyrophosphohydrolase family protein [Bacillota bacterium]|nr:nucleoside triphosphate pyrophosphohydrolase family protein [Bacillota bacterium]
MDLNQYQNEMLRTAGDISLNNENLTLGALGISGEAGEVTDYIKKVVFHGHKLEKEKIILELGDVLWYLSYISKVIDVPLEKIADMNIEKLKKRYPEGFSQEKSINRQVK